MCARLEMPSLVPIGPGRLISRQRRGWDWLGREQGSAEPWNFNRQGSAKTMRKYPILALAAVSAVALATAGHAQQKEVTIAVIGPVTGKEAPFGTQMKMGAEAAVRDLNAA